MAPRYLAGFIVRLYYMRLGSERTAQTINLKTLSLIFNPLALQSEQIYAVAILDIAIFEEAWQFWR